MTQRATGPFEVQIAPIPLSHEDGDALLGRMSIDKQLHGDLEATGQGEMLSARTATSGSAGYVAIEKITGTLHGRAGSFVLQHSSTMNRGEPTQSITVVPDSGTEELTGLEGSMTIEITNGNHFYHFDYSLAESA